VILWSGSQPSLTTGVPGAAEQTASGPLHGLPLAFAPNEGRTAPGVRYYARGPALSKTLG
jgi:hypothetical protein